MTHAPIKLTVAGIIIPLLSFDAAAQTAPNRALSVPRSSPFYSPAGTIPSFPAQASVPVGASSWPAAEFTCSTSLAKEKDRNVLLEEKIAVLEKRIALLEQSLTLAGEPRK